MKIKYSIVSLTIILTAYMAPGFASSLPDDENTAELYEDSCMACHASEHSGAPLAGDKAAWAPRVKKGMDTLLDNTIDGVAGMPALGSCADCTVEDFEALIVFMAGLNQ